MKTSTMLPYTLFQFMVSIMFLGLPAFIASRWCLERKNQSLRAVLRVLLWAGAAACALMCVYGILRLTGAVMLPGDNTYSYNWYDASWRDEGMGLVVMFFGPLSGIAAAQFRARPQDSEGQAE